MFGGLEPNIMLMFPRMLLVLYGCGEISGTLQRYT